MSPRRSTRLQATSKNAKSDTQAAKPSRKVTKVRRNKGDAVNQDSERGRIKCMLDMPTDIVFEVRSVNYVVFSSVFGSLRLCPFAMHRSYNNSIPEILSSYPGLLGHSTYI